MNDIDTLNDRCDALERQISVLRDFLVEAKLFVICPACDEPVKSLIKCAHTKYVNEKYMCRACYDYSYKFSDFSLVKENVTQLFKCSKGHYVESENELFKLEYELKSKPGFILQRDNLFCAECEKAFGIDRAVVPGSVKKQEPKETKDEASKAQT
jgi:hypothetical protein